MLQMHCCCIVLHVKLKLMADRDDFCSRLRDFSWKQIFNYTECILH